MMLRKFSTDIEVFTFIKRIRPVCELCGFRRPGSISDKCVVCNLTPEQARTYAEEIRITA
jgi:hypothetical protein